MRLIYLPIAVPLLAAGLSMAFTGRVGFQRLIGVGAIGLQLAASVLLLVRIDSDGTVAAQVGGWPAPWGISLVADLFAALMLVTAAIVVLAVLVYAIGHPRTRDHTLFFHPVYLILAAGIAASLLAGDLFNLFVAFEIMLVASYVLLTLGGGRDQVRSGMTYVTMSLLGSTLFITAVALIYAATGTVNLADLAGRLEAIPPGLRGMLGLLLLVVFGIKAAVFPLFFWLPDSYPTAPAPVTAVFAGLLTKVGVYAIIRTQTLLFPSDGPSALILVIGGATMVVGVLGAIAQDDMRRILSFHIVSQIGYMIMGLGLFTVAGLAGAVFFLVHNMLVKTTLLLVSGLVEEGAGTSALRRVGGLATLSPFLGALFLLPALSLAGLPPFSGFVGKLALVEAGLAIDAFVIVAVSLVVSIMTLISMMKIWAGAFWGVPETAHLPAGGEPDEIGAAGGTATATAVAKPHLRLPPLMVASTTGLMVLTLLVAVGAGPIYELSVGAAEGLVERAPYVRAVFGA